VNAVGSAQALTQSIMPEDDGVDVFMTWFGSPFLLGFLAWILTGVVGCVARNPSMPPQVPLFYSFTHEGIIGFLAGYIVGLVITVSHRNKQLTTRAELEAMSRPSVTQPVRRVRKCVECGGVVSGTLTECPHCKKDADGKQCQLCGRFGPEAAGTSIMTAHRSYYRNGSRVYEAQARIWSWYHPECFQSLWENCFKGIAVTIECPECGHTEEWSTKYVATDLMNHPPGGPCPRCGRDYWTDDQCRICDHCGFAIYTVAQPYCQAMWSGIDSHRTGAKRAPPAPTTILHVLRNRDRLASIS